VLTHGALHGHRKTLFTVSGGALGFVALIALSMLGIGAVLKASAGALTVLKLLGGAYLIWLGIQLWRAPAIHLQADASKADARGAELFRQGLLTAVSNPKALLFYGAFLPQFIEPAVICSLSSQSWRSTFCSGRVCRPVSAGTSGHRIRPVLERVGKSFNRLCGGMFVGMGVALPMTR
jgi:threonine/homoserine/homoserine lactone efflux protein